MKVDSWILDLDDRNYGTSATAYVELKRMCSHNWEAFNYLQERVHDMRIPARARSKMREIIGLIRMRIYVKQVLHIW